MNAHTTKPIADDTATARSVADTRASIALRFPFWAALLLRLTVRISTATQTAGTDGRTLHVNSAFWATLDASQRYGVLLHETLHCALGHVWRRGARDAHTWNLAADVHCNAVVSTLDWATLPAGHITAASVGLDARTAARMSTEAIYDHIAQRGDAADRACPCSLETKDPHGEHGEHGEHGQGDADDDADGNGTGAPRVSERELEKAWERAVQRAASDAKRAGTCPAGLESYAASVTRTARVDWRALLVAWLTERIPSDYTWARPARRWASMGAYLPALDCEDGVRELILAVDSSGSIGRALLDSMLDACVNAGRSVRAESIRLLVWDTRVTCDEEVTYGDAPALDIARGGTDVACVFEHIAARGYTPSAVVICSDLETPFPDSAPAYPVLWLAPCNASRNAPRVPFGHVVPVWNGEA